MAKTKTNHPELRIGALREIGPRPARGMETTASAPLDSPVCPCPEPALDLVARQRTIRPRVHAQIVTWISRPTLL